MQLILCRLSVVAMIGVNLHRKLLSNAFATLDDRRVVINNARQSS